MPVYISEPFQFQPSSFEHSKQRFELIVRGVRHIGPSYEARVFVGQNSANEETEPTEENGFAGRFHILGHGDCYGAPGHCGPAQQRLAYDTTPPLSSRPIEIHVNITNGLKRAAEAAEGQDLILSIVPIPNRSCPSIDIDEKRVMEVDGRVSIVGYA